MPILGAVQQGPQRPLLILAEKVDGDALGMLVNNNRHGRLAVDGRPGAGLRSPADRASPRSGGVHRRQP